MQRWLLKTLSLGCCIIIKWWNWWRGVRDSNDAFITCHTGCYQLETSIDDRYVYLLFWYSFLKPESKLWQMVRKNLPDIHWTRFESWVNQGVPDLHGICDGIDIFVELKVTSSNKINISPFQKVWNIKHTLHGGRSFIMLQHLSQRALYIFPCSVLHSTLSITPETRPQYRVELPADAAAWAAIHEHLLHSPFPLPKPNTTGDI